LVDTYIRACVSEVKLMWHACVQYPTDVHVWSCVCML
jgi:hypothetical protein